MINVVWLKRDFRIEDHAPLKYSQKNNLPTLFLYVIEPKYWQLNDTSARQFYFISQTIRSYAEELEKLGGFLCIRFGNVVDILSKINTCYPISALFCHQETGNNWTYERDKQVFNWCNLQHIGIHEYRQQAVFRGNIKRANWQKKAAQWLDSPLISAPNRLNSLISFHSGLELLDIYPGNDNFVAQDMQLGGIPNAKNTLNSFFNTRINKYLYGISSPVSSVSSSSRLSPYLCYGSLSLKKVINESYALCVNKRQKAGFISRLYWHSHFVQKLESEPRYELEAVHRSLVKMREGEFDEINFERWKAGYTGVPFVDACMRMLIHTGWINFRMRAMLVAYASYHLWLDWPKTAAYLASTFIDYEPGIHYPQIQMQSGTTGINPPRMYNPVAQGQKLDPQGDFIRRYLPELAHVPNAYLHTPWLYSGLKTDLYDKPDILPKDAARQAKAKVSSYYKRCIDSSETRRVVRVHASRASQANNKSGTNKQHRSQLSLF
ncbi:Cryptochrome-like protein cry2 [Pseudoalteromonas sp. CIP111854]|uniref:Cryptochrome-like protein cry2 n=1 Tax=Pseudoalteromonas holothuriae TaxID=2963714 RepID=A0A9W4VT87_9GAMM|nr:cryptochrome/deoxyribodipyrimidine photo-lyase family protein [Pseudoalteromonas sp. CIP111854]CAH9062413.1 Cryptochrome-like protein cry2 [Pseudoalteromonas sp. CIP111854]